MPSLFLRLLDVRSTGTKGLSKMTTLSDGASAPAARERRLTRAEFEQICFEASKSSTGCPAYLFDVLERVRLLLGVNPSLLPPNLEANADNAQAVVVTLYHLLNDEYPCDFDIAGVLNSYPVDLAESI